MRSQYTALLKAACLVFAVLITLQLARLKGGRDPLEGLALAGMSSAVAALPAASGKVDTNLPPAIRARVGRITESEILGPVVRPQPMALIGIGGDHAFVRTPGGQTVVLREGEDSGGVKLLRIGTNRVLVEHEKETKELTLFSGMGGTTLLHKEK